MKDFQYKLGIGGIFFIPSLSLSFLVIILARKMNSTISAIGHYYALGHELFIFSLIFTAIALIHSEALKMVILKHKKTKVITICLKIWIYSFICKFILSFLFGLFSYPLKIASSDFLPSFYLVIISLIMTPFSSLGAMMLLGGFMSLLLLYLFMFWTSK